MKIIKSEFLTEKEANKTIKKIDMYCENIKIIYNENIIPDYQDYYEEPYDYPMSGGFNFGMISSMNFESYRANDFSRSYNIPNISKSVVLEVTVKDESFDYVKNKLYSLGAMSVI